MIGKLIAALAALLAGTFLPALVDGVVPRTGYHVVRDLAYGPGPRQRLDLYVPDGLKAGSKRSAPVLLFFYGGSWQSGAKDQYLAFGEAFASEGFVVAVADYRLYPQAKFPAFVEDGARAFHFLEGRAAAYGGDPGRIFVSGHSAGAYNAVMLAADPRYLKAAGSDISHLRGAIGLAGPYDFLPLSDPSLIAMFGGKDRKETQPITFVGGRRPVMLLVSGTDDETVGPRNTSNMAARLKRFGSPVEVKFYPGLGHIGLLLSLARPFRFLSPLRADMAQFIRAH
ncbi:MAG TPA: alpha/beta hydrolase [Rhizomicrobium sp.]|nr:alpha/beta hydrolase [Rhizomicrobium sp.]